MKRWVGLVGTVAAVVVAAGCSSGSTGPVEATSQTTDPGPVSLENPFGTGTLTDAYAFREAVLAAIRATGGARLQVTRGGAETALDLSFADARSPARRFVWQESGTTYEQFQLANGRVCANPAAARAVAAMGNNVTGQYVGSGRPYTCSGRDGVGKFAIWTAGTRDPVSRMLGLLMPLSLTDLGTETDQDGTTTRHLQLKATETGIPTHPRPTVYDLWVDDALRPVRAEFTALDDDPEPYAATFAYGDVPTIALPAAEDRGPFEHRPGIGVPGMGGYLLGQFRDQMPEPAAP